MADENELDRLAGLRPPRPPHPTCIETTGPGEMVAGIQSWVCGPDCPRPAGPDPARDARVDAYRDRERRRAARALDRWFEARQEEGRAYPPEALSVTGERFVEAVGDYVLARLGERVAAGPICVCDHPEYRPGACPIHDRE